MVSTFKRLSLAALSVLKFSLFPGHALKFTWNSHRFINRELTKSWATKAAFRSFYQLERFCIPCDMGKKGGSAYYAVARGRKVGIFHTWDECKEQVNAFQNARYKKFATCIEAQAFIKEHMEPGGGWVATASTTSSGLGGDVLAKASTAPAAKKAVGGTGGIGQKRDYSSLKVTEERVVNKRIKLEDSTANEKANLTDFNVDDDGYVVVFTDGACSKNGKKSAKAGIGVWFGHGHPLNISEPVLGRQTNNTAEIQAAERAITQAKENGINKLKLKTDSQFTINCVTKWMNNWRRKGWRLSSGGEVKNKDDLIKLDEAMKNMEIKWSYVAGHAGIEGNEAADRLAVAGAEKA